MIYCDGRPLTDLAEVSSNSSLLVPWNEQIWTYLLPIPSIEEVFLFQGDSELCPCCDGKAVSVKITIYRDVVSWTFLSPAPSVSVVFDRHQYEQELAKIAPPPKEFIHPTGPVFRSADDILDGLVGQRPKQISFEATGCHIELVPIV